MWFKIVPWVLIVLTVGYLYFENSQKSVVISNLQSTIVEQKKHFETKLSVVEFDLESSLEKKYIEKGISYDNNKSVDINSTFIYY